MSKQKEDTGLCGCTVIHENVVADVRGKVLEDTFLVEIAELFKSLNDPTRLKIINALLHAEMCVCDISALLGMSQPAISHHLKILRHMHLVNFRREGKIVYYSIADDHIEPLFMQGLAHIMETKN
ncbi:metalloregulator ArsR/SmtB family transcription factor [Desulfovibrio desulfuricans]|uniref:ArsR/SmtB family transcription factor n=1 Tax=Desulfovibrio desulfuricans TaxID=876 RepID=UPI0003B5E409|nr:metalloregulator ArsR/SmtB family transcription factor [Desulfovibrio desulfuricans]